MDELGFRGTSNGTPSVSYVPVVSSPASRKAAASSRNNATISHFSRLTSPRLPPPGSGTTSTSSRQKGNVTNAQGTKSAAAGTSIPKFRSLRNMLPFGPKQSTSSNSSSSTSLSNKADSLHAPPSPANLIDLRHRRSSSSIPTPPGNANTPKLGFMSVGRRTSLCLAKEKSLPDLPPLHRSHSEDLGSQQSSVIGIAPRSASSGKFNTTQRGLLLPEDPFKKPPPSIYDTFQQHSSREDFGTVRSGGDLSTIVESELSNLSITKPSPPLKALTEDVERLQEKSGERDDGDAESDFPMLAHLAQQDNNNISIMHAQDMDISSAVADLSASWEAGLPDLRRTLNLRVPDDRRSSGGRSPSPSSHSVSPLSFPSPTQEITPPTSVPLSSKSDVQLNLTEIEKRDDEGVSFNLTSLDPDLAALLSSGNIPACLQDDAASAAIAAAVDSVQLPSPMHSSPSASPEREESRRRTSFETEDIWPTASCSRRTSIDSRKRTVGLQSSPMRRSRPSSIVLSSDSLPLADRALKASPERTPVNTHIFRPMLAPTPRPDFISPRASLEDLPDIGRRPLLALSHSSVSRPATSTEPTRSRTARLYMTPSRPSTVDAPSVGRISSDSGRPFLRGSQAREEHSAGSFTLGSHSRSATSLGLSSRTRRVMRSDSLERPGTALSTFGRGPPPLPQRNRKRSLSAAADYRTRTPVRAPDWMGPRTARAFAAAGLLDSDHSAPPPVPSRAESRLRVAPLRTSSEREYRRNGDPQGGSVGTSSAASSHAPSRMGYSEHGYSPSTRRRRSMSRTMAMTELASARGESPVTATTTSSNSRTVFSSSTTTSLTCSSPHQQYQTAHFESALSSLKEKHVVEMEALLSALADSQRTSKNLREENIQLHGRIRDLEEQLADSAEQLEDARRIVAQPPMPNSSTRTLLHHQRSGVRTSPLTKVHALDRSTTPSPANDSDGAEAHSTMRVNGLLLTPSFTALHSRGQRERKRASTTSSVFPVMPSNMSMLLHDEGSDANPSSSALVQSHAYASSSGSPPPSPTMNLTRMAASSTSTERNRHATKLSLSSIEMSMLSSLPGSPESLKLKPEHERHLCDLKSLDFSVVDSD